MRTDDPPSPEGMNGHPSSGDMAAYIEGTATADMRAVIEAHLADCADCREELVVVRDATRSSSARLRWVAGAAAAAAAIAVLLVAPAMIDDGAERTLRDSRDVSPGSVEVIEASTPTEGMAVDPDAVRFVWRSVGDEAQYRFTLTTVDGDPVASLTTEDTLIADLPNAELAPGTEYFWWVDALLPDGETAESGLHRFRTSP